MGMKEISAYWAKYAITPVSVWKQKNDHAEGAAISWLCGREGVHSQSATMIFGEKLPKKLPTNASGTSGLPTCATFYSKTEELQEYRLPSLLFLREPKKAVRRMANLGQTKGPFSPAACLLHAHEQMLREECKKRTNIE